MVSNLVGVVVADDALVLREAQFTALICGQSKGRQEARSQSMDWSIVIGNCKDRAAMLTTLQTPFVLHTIHTLQHILLYPVKCAFCTVPLAKQTKSYF